MNTYLKKISCFVFILFFYNLSFAQVGIGTVTPNSDAALEIASNNQGVLLPRVALSATNSTSPLGAHVAGMTLYNTATAGSAPNQVAPGFYFNDGAKWVRLPDASPIVIFTASLGTGAGGATNATITASGFNTVPLPNVTTNIGGGTWNAGSYTYTVPITGTYYIKSSVRLTDNSASRNIFQAVHTSNADIPDGIWQTNSGNRWTMLYNRIAYFTQGQVLRLYVYSDGSVANLSDASLNITLLR